MHRVPKVSVVIINWNCKDDLPTCLGALERQTERDFEIILVDNGSIDDSVEMVRRDFPDVRIIETGKNLGFAEGCNVGIEHARGEWIATLNPDTEADPRWLEELLEVVQRGGPRLGMVQSRIVFRHAPDRTNSTGVLVFRNATFVDRSFDMPAHDDEPADEIFCASAGAALYRRSMLDEVRLPTGYFDKTFFMYFEDVDLGWRCRLAGWSARYAPRAIVRHGLHASSKRKGATFVARQCNYNRVRTLAKNASPGLLVRSVPRLLADMKWSVRHEGPAAVARYLEAARDGFVARPRVETIAQVARREVERRWVELRAPGSSSPRISVVITAPDASNAADETLRSALAQTLSPIEILVVGDDSAKRWGSEKLVRFVSEPSTRPAVLRNRGARAAKGDYLVFLDAGDLLEPEYLARCWDALRTAPRHVAYAHTKPHVMGEASHKERGTSRMRDSEGQLATVAALLRRKAFDEVGGFDESLPTGFEGAELWVRLLDRGYRGVFVPEPLLHNRRHGRSRNGLEALPFDAPSWQPRIASRRLDWADILRAPRRAASSWLRAR